MNELDIPWRKKCHIALFISYKEHCDKKDLNFDFVFVIKIKFNVSSKYHRL